jgi:hypothetical protein
VLPQKLLEGDGRAEPCPELIRLSVEIDWA